LAPLAPAPINFGAGAVGAGARFILAQAPSAPAPINFGAGAVGADGKEFPANSDASFRLISVA
jgi:hypothetical protein